MVVFVDDQTRRHRESCAQDGVIRMFAWRLAGGFCASNFRTLAGRRGSGVGDGGAPGVQLESLYVGERPVSANISGVSGGLWRNGGLCGRVVVSDLCRS